MANLSVNINKIATIRNARGGNNPNLVQVAIDCEEFGAQGITVHPRPDERHIRREDVYALKKVVKTEFNIEGYPSEDFIQLIKEIKPEQCTLVPDPPHVLTSNTGWDTIKHAEFLKEVVAELKKYSRVSLFLNPEIEMVKAAKDCGTDRIEFYTGPYADNFNQNKEEAIADYVSAAKVAQELGLGINAGHDLDLQNLQYFKECIPNLAEVSIGHALICDSLYFGLENTIRMYRAKLM